MESIIKFENVCFAYDVDQNDARHNILENFNLEIGRGEFVAVLGHNGSGKSTFAKLCNGIEIPQSGSVTVDGMSTANEEQLYDIRRRVGMVFQNPDNQIVGTIVEDDVAFGPENLGVEPVEIRRRVDDALKSVGMFDFRLFEPHKLSGGQKQRVAIAGILAMEPECIIFDESTAMLDPHGRAEVIQTAKRFNEQGITIILVTHFMDEAALAGRVIVMNKGKIILDGSPAEVFAGERKLNEAGLAPPEITLLARKLKSDGLNISPNTLTVDELAGEILKGFGK